MAKEEIWHHLNSLTKPPGSLGRLEHLAARLCSVQQSLRPQTKPRRLVVFAGDHGVVESGVSAWPSEVTGLMLRNICAGGAASSVLAWSTGTELVLVNVGTKAPSAVEQQLAPTDRQTTRQIMPVRYRDCCVRAGTGNLACEAAMTVAEFERVLEVGREEVCRASQEGMRVLAAGEMGIGNSTSAAALAVLLADVPIEHAVGRGAGADDETLNRKREIVARAVKRVRRMNSRDRAIAEIGGLEIAAMAGFFVEAHARGLTLVLDGYIASAAALVATHLVPEVTQSMIASHLSAEPGHAFVLQHLQLTPFLHWDLRLGEGTGALLLMPLLDAAAAITSQMATFQEMGMVAEVQQ